MADDSSHGLRPVVPPDPPARRRVHLRGQEWFPIRSETEIAEMIAEGEDPSQVTAGDKLLAILYLTSVILVPVVAACWIFGLWGTHGIYYAIPLFAAGAVPWLLTSELCESQDRSTSSLLVLRTQVWLHVGGAVSCALRTVRSNRTPVAG